MRLATMISPKGKPSTCRSSGGFVGMVDRDEFDEWLRERAAKSGATRIAGRFERITRDADGVVSRPFRAQRTAHQPSEISASTRLVIGADGANSTVGRQEVPGADRGRFVFAYHEIIATPRDEAQPIRRTAAKSTTAAHCRPTSTPGSSRMATR